MNQKRPAAAPETRNCRRVKMNTPSLRGRQQRNLAAMSWKNRKEVEEGMERLVSVQIKDPLVLIPVSMQRPRVWRLEEIALPVPRIGCVIVPHTSR
jgi:hypothetical protein